MKKLSILVLSLAVLMPLTSMAQEYKKPQHVKDKEAAMSAGGASITLGRISYLNLRRETLYKRSPLSPTSVAISKVDLDEVIKKLKPNDRIKVISTDASNTFKLSNEVKITKGTVKEVLEDAIKQISHKEGYSVKAIQRVNNMITIDVIKRAAPLEKVLTLATIGSATYGVYKYSRSVSNKAKARFDGGRSSAGSKPSVSSGSAAADSSVRAGRQ